ncbi:MAG: hypothetical protein QOF89_5754 [Acidobacteriota bacterium]|nr:hypothetical protein [Acidobacteriota bacterium]
MSSLRRLRPLRRWLLPVVLFLSFAATLAAQTTGGIVGRVTDEAGGVLPGMAVEAQSPSLQGSRTAVTDSTGAYRLTLLPPGDYTVTFTGQGFATEAKQGVTVSLNKDSTLNVSLRAAVTEEITVTSAVPLVDTTSTALGTNLNAGTIQALPTARNYSAVVQITPGVSSDANPDNGTQSSIAVYGSTGAENVFYIDGVNTTGAEYGFQGKELNFEFIQAVDVKTGGYEAEYGRSTGGVINVITKSGATNSTVMSLATSTTTRCRATPSPWSRPAAPSPASPSRTTALASAAVSSRTSSGSSPPTTRSPIPWTTRWTAC